MHSNRASPPDKKTSGKLGLLHDPEGGMEALYSIGVDRYLFVLLKDLTLFPNHGQEWACIRRAPRWKMGFPERAPVAGLRTFFSDAFRMSP
ncbi:MAG TPA: hypothetical protein PK491_04990 [Candidatus Hydrogenedentes bacterium]|nr:hypothetical protein [Candidatus Hydrogenedentota bacterium]